MDSFQFHSIYIGISGISTIWTNEHDTEFEELKSKLCRSHLLRAFDFDKKTEVITDASRLKGLGYALIQRTNEGRPILIACGSRSLTSAEKNYATIELECLAVIWAVKKLRHYLLGMKKFSISTMYNSRFGFLGRIFFFCLR